MNTGCPALANALNVITTESKDKTRATMDQLNEIHITLPHKESEPQPSVVLSSLPLVEAMLDEEIQALAHKTYFTHIHARAQPATQEASTEVMFTQQIASHNNASDDFEILV